MSGWQERQKKKTGGRAEIQRSEQVVAKQYWNAWPNIENNLANWIWGMYYEVDERNRKCGHRVKDWGHLVGWTSDTRKENIVSKLNCDICGSANQGRKIKPVSKAIMANNGNLLSLLCGAAWEYVRKLMVNVCSAIIRMLHSSVR